MPMQTGRTRRGSSAEDARDLEVVDIRHRLRAAARSGRVDPEVRAALARLAEIAHHSGETALRYELERWRVRLERRATPEQAA